MVDVIISSMIGALVGVIAFVVVKQIVAGQTTTGWSAAERAVIDVIPIALGVMVLVVIFSGLQVRR